MKTEFKICVTLVNPPIPIRWLDWVAYYDGQEEDGPRGTGKTAKDAINDLLDNTDQEL